MSHFQGGGGLKVDERIPLAVLSPKPSLAEMDEIFANLHPLVSDIFIQPDVPLCVRFGGHLVRASAAPFGEEAMKTLIEAMVTTAKSSEIAKGFPQGWVHKIRRAGAMDAKAHTLRFRCNSKSVQTLFAAEARQLTMRPIPLEPRRLSTLSLPPALVDGLFPENGIVLFSGPTGSGKTTTLAAVMGELCYIDGGRVIITIEDPIEYNLHVLPNITGFVTHCELGRNVQTFPLAMRAALRENPDVIMTGEMRDEDSMLIAIEASQTGHSVYSTIHCNSVTNVFVRVAQKFPPARVDSVLSTFIESSRTFVYQRLFPAQDGGVVPLLEYICLTPSERVELLRALSKGGVAAVSRTMTEIMGNSKSAQWYTDAATSAFAAGRLSQKQYDTIVHSYKMDAVAERGGNE